jgi:hypothetical protein
MSSPDAVTDFDPSRSKIVTSRAFEELNPGRYSALPAEPLPDAHASAFQAQHHGL